MEKNARIELRINSLLKESMKKYCIKNNINLTLFCEYAFKNLLNSDIEINENNEYYKIYKIRENVRIYKEKRKLHKYIINLFERVEKDISDHWLRGIKTEYILELIDLYYQESLYYYNNDVSNAILGLKYLDYENKYTKNKIVDLIGSKFRGIKIQIEDLSKNEN